MVSDGCTGWIDGWFGISWLECCEIHDLNYAEMMVKVVADFNLGLCVAQSGDLFMGIVMTIGLSLFGWLFYPSKKSKNIEPNEKE